MFKSIMTPLIKNNILDPLSLVIKLYIYAYLPNYTKISIINHKLLFQEYSYFQGTIRSINGDNKNDITMLKFPLLYACSKYIKCYGDDHNNNLFKILFEKNIVAFDKLETLYNGTEISNTIINDLKNIISSYLRNDEDAIGTITMHNNTNNYKMKTNMYNSLDEVWTPDRLNIIFCYISDIEKTDDVLLKTKFVNSLLTYIECIDVITSQTIQSFN